MIHQKHTISKLHNVKTVKARQWTYDELRKIGVMGMDFDDVITKLIMEYRKRHG